MKHLLTAITAIILSYTNVFAQSNSVNQAPTCYRSMDPELVNQYVPGSPPSIDSLEVSPLGQDTLLVSFNVSSVCYPVYFHDETGARIDSTFSDGRTDIRLRYVLNDVGQYSYWFSASNTRGKTVESRNPNRVPKK